MPEELSAVRKGLEPSTSGVTGRHSNQLNYRTGCAGLRQTRMQIYILFRELQYSCRKN